MNLKILIFFLVFFLYKNVDAQLNGESEIIKNVHLLWELALKNNSNLKLVQLKTDQLRLDYDVSQAYKYPQIKGNVNIQDNIILPTTAIPGALFGQSNTTKFVQFGTKYNYNTGIYVIKNLFDGQLKALSKIAKENIELNKAEALSSIQTIKVQITQHYYTILLANVSNEILKNDVLIGKSILDLSKQKFEQGLIDGIMYNQAKISYNLIKQQIIQNKELMLNEFASIHKLIGNDTLPINLISNSIEIEELSKKNYIEMGIDKNLLALPYYLKIQKYKHQYIQAGFFPTFTFMGYFGFQNFNNTFSLDFKKSDWTNYQYLSLNVSIPIFVGFANKNKLKSNQIENKIIEEKNKFENFNSKINDEKIIQSNEHFFEIMQESKNNYVLYDEIKKLQYQKYMNGVISQDIFLKSMDEYLKSLQIYINNLSNLLFYQAILISRK